ncbi:XkdF [Vibrio phage 1.121.O._10N.286.46.C4]|nr:XkdF [Vibrio phage 1.121.O._10N.286.46.C4]
MSDGRISALIKALKKISGEDSLEDQPEVINKSVNVEERKTLEVLFVPSHDIENPVRDAHESWYTPETIVKAQVSYEANKESVPSNLFHMEETEAFTVEETFILEEDTVYESGVEVAKGTMLGWIKYEDEELWEIKKSNSLGGMSPAFYGTTNKETGEITNIGFTLEDHHKLVEESDA